MSMLFEEATLGGLRLRNRILKSSTHMNLSGPDGLPTEASLEYNQRLAQGGCALLMAGFAYINQAGQSYRLQDGIHLDATVPAWRKITEVVHEAGAKIGMQIAHGGRQVKREEVGGREALAPSPVPNLLYFTRSRAMKENEIRDTIRDFGEAAGRVKEAGFDAVQIHAAHGYLISGFLSPLTNWRRDDWGGDPQRRFRFLAEVYGEVRRAVGPHFPVLCKLNMDDFLWFGLRARDSLLFAQLLAAMGLDGLELSGGINETGQHMSRGGMPLEIVTRGRSLPARLYLRLSSRLLRPRRGFQEAYFLPYAETLKRHLRIPVILVGGIRSPRVAENILRGGKSDFVSLARPLIREPGLPNRWQGGDLRPAFCTSCNACLAEMERGTKVECFSRGEGP